MKNISKITQDLIEELYAKISDKEVDEILESVSRKTPIEGFEKMDSSIKKIYERLDFSKKTPEERKKIACGIYVQELIEQVQMGNIK